ncbi:MAG: hypothetical protein D6698_13105, partial [Gammaproteobacteria bacterium]
MPVKSYQIIPTKDPKVFIHHIVYEDENGVREFKTELAWDGKIHATGRCAIGGCGEATTRCSKHKHIYAKLDPKKVTEIRFFLRLGYTNPSKKPKEPEPYILPKEVKSYEVLSTDDPEVFIHHIVYGDENGIREFKAELAWGKRIYATGRCAIGGCGTATSYCSTHKDIYAKLDSKKVTEIRTFLRLGYDYPIKKPREPEPYTL